MSMSVIWHEQFCFSMHGPVGWHELRFLILSLRGNQVLTEMCTGPLVSSAGLPRAAFPALCLERTMGFKALGHCFRNSSLMLDDIVEALVHWFN